MRMIGGKRTDTQKQIIVKEYRRRQAIRHAHSLKRFCLEVGLSRQRLHQILREVEVMETA